MKYDWIKSIPGYLEYFNADHRLIIGLVGFNNYFKLYEHFGKTGIYFPGNSTNNDQVIITNMIGEENYQKLFQHFRHSCIYFSSSPLIKLKRYWAQQNHHIDRLEAARILDVSTKTIYNWRQEAGAE